jgi:hypothetical protein
MRLRFWKDVMVLYTKDDDDVSILLFFLVFLGFPKGRLFQKENLSNKNEQKRAC